MNFLVMENISKSEIEDILSCSKAANKKYLDKVLSIKNISSFDMAYIMAALKLTDKKIKLIEYAIGQYNKIDKIKSNESINEYVYEVIKNIEKLENSHERLLTQSMDCRNEILGFKKILQYIIEGNLKLFKLKENNFKQSFAFSTVYFDWLF